jgi:hypothetical protein
MSDGNSSKPGWSTAKIKSMAGGKPVLVPGSMKPIDINKLPLQQRALLGLLADEFEKAENAGVENPKITLTRDMLNAKVKTLKEEKRKKKHKRKG